MAEYSFLHSGFTVNSEFRLFVSGNSQHPFRAKIFAEVVDHLIHQKGFQPLSILNQNPINSRCWLRSIHLQSVYPFLEFAFVIQFLRDMGSACFWDLHLVPESWITKPVRLILIDVDSTLIEQETIDEFATLTDHHGTIAQITRRAMDGELSFSEALAERVKLLKGVTLSAMETVFKRLRVRPEMEVFISKAQIQGIQVALVSGGFDFIVARLAKQLKISYFLANRLEFQDGRCLGIVPSDVVNDSAKRMFLLNLCEQLQMGSDDVMAIGDGANDIALMQTAKFGVGIYPKKILEPHVAVAIHHGSIGVLHYMIPSMKGSDHRDLK